MSNSGTETQTVLLVTHGPLDQISGGSLYNRKLASGLRRLGTKVHVMELPPVGYMASLAGSLRPGLRRALSGPWDAVLLDEWVHPRLLFLGKGVTSPVIPVVHLLRVEDRLPPIVRSIVAAVERRVLRRASLVVTNSNATAAAVRDLLVGPGHARTQSLPVVVCPPGCDAVPEADRPDQLDAGRDDPVPEILCVANILPVKGQDLLVEALAPHADLPWRLHLVGHRNLGNRYTGELRRRIARAGLADRVIMEGAVTEADLSLLYRDASLFVLPSRHEAWGISLAEAMRSGLPFVAFRTGGVPEVTSGQGLLVAPGDTRSFGEQIRRLLCDPGFRARQADLSKRLAFRLPCWGDTVACVHQTLQDLSSIRP